MGTEHPSEKFPQPENETKIMSAWERFLGGETCASDALRRLIDDSWRRSQTGHVDPDRSQAPLILSEDSLHSLLEKQDELLCAGAPVMADARQFLDATGTVIVLATTDGVILNLEGDPSTFGAAERIHLLPGGSWDESVCGTNAVGTALAIGQPVQIHGAEHYCAGMKPWTCSATVIRDPYNNSILGVVNVSGMSSTYNRHCLALVMTTASRIESRLARREMELRYHLLERCMSRVASATSDGVIVLDRRGNPIKASATVDAALRALSESTASASGINLSTLKIPATFKNELPAKLPEWINQDWLEPIVDQGHRLGSLLTIPHQGSRATPRRSEEAVAKHSFLKNAAFERVIGKAPNLLEIIGCAQRLARSNVPVLLLGETGVGKDVFARAIHETGGAQEAPFVALNCGGFSRELLTSELFGYVEGSFTGARRGGMMGKIEAANGGTLFLDEIGEMPIDLQPHFLRVLEEGAIYRLGENKARKVAFRLVAATNRDLRKEVAEGRFRMDLFYRIAVASINIPPLRDRAEDIEPIAEFLLDKLALQHGLPRPELDEGALACMAQYAWPGNIRELRNVLERALLMSSGPVLAREALPAEVRFTGRIAAPSRAVSTPPEGELKHLEQVEKETIISMIERQRGNMTAVARELGIAKSTLYVKLKKFDIALSGGAWVEATATRLGPKPSPVFSSDLAPRVLSDA
ncbi:sigma-54-dependent Fis family transcriptional regulator [Methylibium sp.]|uniref:sigma-54-dependent Fis family transcriptional regulator n=1 Tax=Methylibium sp. TaxID=2067992 RepID=UPI003D0CA6D3